MKTTRRGSAVTTVENPLYTEGSVFPPTEDYVSKNDLVLEELSGKGTKDIAFVEGKAAVANVVEAIVLTNRGELALDINRGIPYLASVLGSYDRNALIPWVSAMQDSIRNAQGVAALNSFSYKITNTARGRVLSYNATFKTIDGEKASITNLKEID